MIAGAGGISAGRGLAAPVWLFLLLGVVFVVFFPAYVRAQSIGQEFIPPENWCYPALQRFEVLGLVSLPTETPYLRDDVGGYVIEIKRNIEASGAVLDGRDRFNLDRLEQEFSEPASREDPELRWDRPVLYAKEDLLSLEGDLEVGVVPEKPEFDDRWWVFGVSNISGKLNFGKWVTYDFRYRLVYGPERDNRENKEKPDPRTRSWHGLTSLYERAYVVFRWKRLSFFWGRDYADWGPEDRGGLILSRTAQSFDKLGGRVGFKNFRLSFLHAHLHYDPKRTFSAHRLEFDVRKFTFGFVETAVYTNRGIDPIYTLPLSSFYANQFNERKDDNLLWSLDMKYRAHPGTLLYGSFLIDDFQFERDGKNPDKIGFDIGGRFAVRSPAPAELRLEYRYIDIYTYTHRDSLKYYVTGMGDPVGGDPPLGAYEGPDGDVIAVALDVYPLSRLTTSLRGSQRRRGEGSDWRHFEEGVDDPFPPFPSGVVERTLRFELGLKWEFNGNSFAGVDLGWAKVKNKNHHAGVDDDGPVVRLYASWDL